MLLNRIRRYLARRTFIANVMIVAGGAAFAQGLALIVSPLLTRLYTPDDLGVLGAFVSLFSIILTANSLSYEVAVPLPEDDETAANLLALTLALLCLSTAIVIFIVWGWHKQIANLINAPALQFYLWLLPLSLFAGGVYQVSQYWLVRKKHFTDITSTRVWQSVSMTGTQLGTGWIGSGVLGLLLGHTVGYISSGIVSARYAWKSYRAVIRQVNWRGMRVAARRYRRFPLFTSWSSAINVSGVMLPPLFITTLYGTQIGGWFTLSQRIVILPLTLIGTAIAQVYFGTASQLKHQNPRALQALFNKIALRLAIVGAVPAVVLLVAAPALFTTVFGANWQTAGEYVQLLAPVLWTQFIISPLSQTINIMERQDIQLAWDVGRLGVVLAVFGLAWRLNLDVTVTIALYTGGMFLLYLLLFFINVMIIRRYIHEVS
ncbi:MAG: oligosaccharide flippase family protein [Anaerolineae bacterium]|nr:oligosaccharide flippase family protein [Anaerolineae bacterium]